MNITVNKCHATQGSPEWHELRKKYIGASEIGTLLNIDPYRNVKDLLLSKAFDPKETYSPQMYIGKLFEKDILDKFAYYEYDEKRTMGNYINNKRIREPQKVEDSYILTIDNISFLVSPDGIIKEDDSIVPVETKFVSEFSIRKNNIGVSNGKYAWQSIMQQLVFNTDKGYIFTLVDNKAIHFDVVQKSKFIDLIPSMLKDAEMFYKYLNEIKEENLTVSETVSRYYPEIKPTTLGLYLNNEVYIQSNENKVTEGDDEDANLALDYLKSTTKESQAKEMKEYIKNYFRIKYPAESTIVADIYKITLTPKFSIRITEPINIDELPDSSETMLNF